MDARTGRRRPAATNATKTAWPYYLAIFVAITLVTYVPSFSTWLPTLITGHPVF